MGQSGDLVIGIDLGTQGLRALVVDRHGSVLAQASRPIASHVDETGRFEQDTDQWWQAAAQSLREALTVAGVRNRIAALSVTATSGTICLLDRESLAPTGADVCGSQGAG